MPNQVDIYNSALIGIGADTIDDPATITGATKANPCVISAAGHPFANGATIFIAEIKGMTELNDRAFTVAGVVAGVSFQLSGVDSTAYTTYVSGGIAIYNNDKKSRLCNKQYRVARDKVLESQAWNCVTRQAQLDFDKVTITNATQASPVVISAVNDYSDGDHIEIGDDVEDVVGMTELNNVEFIIANATSTQFALTDLDGDDIDGTAYAAYVSGGEARRVPKFSHDYQYALPSDCLRVNRLTDDRGTNDYEHKIEMGYLLCDQDEAFIYYNARITDVDAYNMTLREVIALRLALDIVYALTNSRTLMADIASLYRTELLEAEGVDAQEGSSEAGEYEDPWLEARK